MLAVGVFGTGCGEKEKQVFDKKMDKEEVTVVEEYEKRSAICWADEIKIPVLMFHSRNDEKVSFSQAEAMYQALKEEGTECSFVVYEDDIHGMREEEIPIINQWLNGEDISKYTVK